MDDDHRDDQQTQPPEVSIWNTDHHQAERYTGTEWEQDDWPHLLPPPHVHREIHTTWTSGVTMREETQGDWKTQPPPRCKSCGNPRDLLDLYGEPICNPCALVLVLGHKPR